MFWPGPRDYPSLSRAEAARRRHAAWLDGALQSPSGALPRIPVRAVEEGGFSPLLAEPHGREWAESWWFETLDRADLDVTEG